VTKRRDKGSGSIYREGDAWRGEIVLDGHRHRRRGNTKSEVQDKLNALKRDHLTGNLSADTTTTVEALLTHYLDRVVPNRKGGNLSPMALYRYKWAANHITEQIGRECRQMLDGRDEYRNAEPLRLLEMMRKGKKVSTEDILEDLAVYDASHALALARTVTTRKMVNRQAVELGHGILRRHSEDILEVVAEAVVNDQMTPALIDAWGRVEKV